VKERGEGRSEGRRGEKVGEREKDGHRASLLRFCSVCVGVRRDGGKKGKKDSPSETHALFQVKRFGSEVTGSRGHGGDV